MFYADSIIVLRAITPGTLMWRRLQPTSSIITDAKLVYSNLCDFAMQGWRRLKHGADVITGLSRRHFCRFSQGYISLSTRHWHLSFLFSSKIVENCIYAKMQAEICMFTQQNRRGLNRPILRPLWLMTSAAADVISVPGVRAILGREIFIYSVELAK